jgi:hypothetical protein
MNLSVGRLQECANLGSADARSWAEWCESVPPESRLTAIAALAGSTGARPGAGDGLFEYLDRLQKWLSHLRPAGPDDLRTLLFYHFGFAESWPAYESSWTELHLKLFRNANAYEVEPAWRRAMTLAVAPGLPTAEAICEQVEDTLRPRMRADSESEKWEAAVVRLAAEASTRTGLPSERLWGRVSFRQDKNGNPVLGWEPPTTRKSAQQMHDWLAKVERGLPNTFVLKIQSELDSLRRRLTQLGATGPQPCADATFKTVDEPSNPEMHNNWD